MPWILSVCWYSHLFPLLRSVQKVQNWYLDDYVAALFALLAEGAMLITLHPLNLGPSLKDANDKRARHNLARSENASFYSYDKVEIGPAGKVARWTKDSGNTEMIYAHRYIRVCQPGGKAVFLCSNFSGCRTARQGIPIPATFINDEGRLVPNVCECRHSQKTFRNKPKVDYRE